MAGPRMSYQRFGKERQELYPLVNIVQCLMVYHGPNAIQSRRKIFLLTLGQRQSHFSALVYGFNPDDSNYDAYFQFLLACGYAWREVPVFTTPKFMRESLPLCLCPRGLK